MHSKSLVYCLKTYFPIMESSKLWNKLVRSKTRHFSKFCGKVGVVYISVAFPSHLENYVLNRDFEFWFEKLNCGFYLIFFSLMEKTPQNIILCKNFRIENNILLFSTAHKKFQKCGTQHRTRHCNFPKTIEIYDPLNT